MLRRALERLEEVAAEPYRQEEVPPPVRHPEERPGPAIRRPEDRPAPPRRPAERSPGSARSGEVVATTLRTTGATRSPLAAMLSSRASLRQAILLQEILGPPKALQRDDQTRGDSV
jgi:hypothetical protein